MRSRRCIFVHSEALDRHAYPEGSPFDTGRARRALKIVRSLNLLAHPDLEVAAPTPATEDDLFRVHTPRYLRTLREAEQGEFKESYFEIGLGTPECPAFPGMVDYARLAAGGTLLGARLLRDGEAGVVFNPSGGYHHAFPEKASGFCYLNDVAMAADLLAEAGRRVAVVDVDAHHGDGVQHIFYPRRDVLTLSLHESGRTLFPGTGFEDEVGEGPGRGYAANLPVPVGTFDTPYLEAFDAFGFPLLRAFDPDVIVLVLGMDGLAGDPLAHLRLSNNVFPRIIETLAFFDAPVLAVGGGGYHPEHTARAWALCWSALTGQEQGEDDQLLGLGGVMLQSTDWQGGLRDRESPVAGPTGDAIRKVIRDTTARARRNLFPLHGLDP